MLGAGQRAGAVSACLTTLLALQAHSGLADTATFRLPATIFTRESTGPVPAGEMALFGNATLAGQPALEVGFHLDLDLRQISSRSVSSSPPPDLSVSVARRAGVAANVRPWTTGAMNAAAIGFSLVNALSEPSVDHYHFQSEGFFGADTYAGGADKAAHFVDYAIVGKLFEDAYRRTGYTEGQSRWMAFASSVGTGLATEVGDGATIFGFSWEDLLMNTLGAASSMGLSETGLDDTIGFRLGFGVSQEPSPPSNPSDHNIGRDYSGEIYTADLKIAGLARRMHRDAGPARFLLFSATYGSNGYKSAPPEMRQRLVGLEIGIAFPEILRSLGVPSEPLWGGLLYKVFEMIRIPYTAIGVRYDLNHHQWFGPTTGRTAFKK